MTEKKERIQYFRVRRGLTTSGYFLDLSSDGARLAVIRMWDQAKDLGGVFDSEQQLRELMGRFYRHVGELREKRWLDGLEVHDWYDDQVNPEQQRLAGKRSAEARRRLFGSAQPPVSEINSPNDRSKFVRNDPPNGSPERPFEKPSPPSPERPFEIRSERTPERPVPNAPEPTETETETEVLKGNAGVKAREAVPASTARPPGAPDFVHHKDSNHPEIWWDEGETVAWQYEKPPTPAEVEIRLKRTVALVQEAIHGYGQTASYRRVRRELEDNPHWTAKDFEAALRHPAVKAEQPKDVFGFVTAVYADQGLCIVERCYRQRLQVKRDQEQSQLAAETEAFSPKEFVRQAAAKAAIDPDDLVDPDDLPSSAAR